MVATSTPAVPSPPAPAAAASAAPGLSGSAAAPAPCRTLYVRNLCEKPKKEKLRVLLHALFSPYGEIEWISAQKTIKLRGQAFITFRDIAGATAALRRLQGASFLSRPLRIFYARSESDRAVAPGAARGAARKARKTRPRPRAPAPDAPAPPPQEMPVAMEEAEPDVPQNTPPVQPNRVLFAQQTPPGGALAERCARLAGFVEVRSAPGKPGIAFVEFNTEANAAVAVAALDGVVLVEGTPPLQIAYAKK